MRAQLTWSEIAASLTAPRNYWLATVDHAGTPHTSPVWGVVVDEVFYFYASARAAKARHMATNPHVALNLEDADNVLLLRGEARRLAHPADSPAVIAAYVAKYTAPDDLPYVPTDPTATDDVLFALHPTWAATWRLSEFETSQRRWRSA